MPVTHLIRVKGLLFWIFRDFLILSEGIPHHEASIHLSWWKCSQQTSQALTWNSRGIHYSREDQRPSCSQASRKQSPDPLTKRRSGLRCIRTLDAQVARKWRTGQVADVSNLFDRRCDVEHVLRHHLGRLALCISGVVHRLILSGFD
jgi:hypothetical protein